MEEQILKILQNKIYYSEYNILVKVPLNDCAKEIVDYFREFMEWEKNETDFNYSKNLYIIDIRHLEHNDDLRFRKEYRRLTLDELYLYWLEHIKNK